VARFGKVDEDKSNPIHPKTKLSLLANNPPKAYQRMKQLSQENSTLKMKDWKRKARNRLKTHGIYVIDKQKRKKVMSACKEAEEKVSEAFPSDDDEPMRRLLKAKMQSMEEFARNGYKKSKQFRFDPIALSFSILILAKVGKSTYNMVVEAFNMPTASHVSLSTILDGC
jgi:hypothetical protein